MADKQSFFEQNLDLFKHVIGQNPSSLSGIKSGDTSFAIRDQDFAAVKNALGGLDAVMLCVEGIGKEIAEVFALTQSEYFTRKRAIYLVARQAVHFAPLFELADFKNIINSERVFFFADDIHGSLEEFFQTNTAKPLPTGVICLGVGDELYTRTTSSVQQCHNWRNKRIEQLKNELFAHYADFDAGKVFESGRSLTLFSFTSRFTSYVRYCTFDCAEAFNQAGHNMQIWIESHDTDRLNGLVLLENLCRIKPDAVFSIDHTRYEHAGVYPENLPFITWVQDQLPAIFDEQTACDSGSLDFFFTSGFRQRMLNLGFRPERVFSFIECTNFRRFYPLEGKTDKKFEAQVSFVSHASSTPLQEFEAFLSEFTQLGAPEVLLDFARKFYVRLESFFASGKALYGYKEYEKLFDELCAEYGLEFAGVLAPLGRAVFERFYHVIGNRFFRHMPLLWAAEMGVDLKLWGHGWEKHPALGRFACGVADNEAELNSVFCGSAVNLHLSHHTDVVHPRLLDCMSAGGNCLIRTNGLFTWKNFFIFESMWFDSKADFYQKIDFMLDKKNSDINRKIAHKLVDSVSCNYSYDTGVEYILEALKMSFAADKTGFVEIVKRADAITIAGDFKRVVGGLLPVKHQEYLSQQAFLLVHAVCGAKKAADFCTALELSDSVDFPGKEEFDAKLAELENLILKTQYDQAFDLCRSLVPGAHISFTPFLFLQMLKLSCFLKKRKDMETYLQLCARFYWQMRRCDADRKMMNVFGRKQGNEFLPEKFYGEHCMPECAKLLNCIAVVLEPELLRHVAWLGLYRGVAFLRKEHNMPGQSYDDVMQVFAGGFDAVEMFAALSAFIADSKHNIDSMVFAVLVELVQDVAKDMDDAERQKLIDCLPFEQIARVYEEGFCNVSVPYHVVEFIGFLATQGHVLEGKNLSKLLCECASVTTHEDWSVVCGLLRD